MKDLTIRDNKPYRIVQTISLGNVLNSVTGSPAGYAKKWTSADINQFSNFAAVFDQYKIEFVEFWINPYGSGSVSGYNPGASNPRLYSVTDYDDANNFSTANQAMQYQNCIVSSLQQGHYRALKPHMALGAYSGSVFTGFSNKPSDWIDCASTTVEHYGVKVIVDATGSNNDVRFDAFTRVHIAFRNVF